MKFLSLVAALLIEQAWPLRHANPVYATFLRYAAALEDFTRPEPLPWSEFFIAHGRALAACGRGRRDAALRAEIQWLRSEGERQGLRIALDDFSGRDREVSLLAPPR